MQKYGIILDIDQRLVRMNFHLNGYTEIKIKENFANEIITILVMNYNNEPVTLNKEGLLGTIERVCMKNNIEQNKIKSVKP